MKPQILVPVSPSCISWMENIWYPRFNSSKYHCSFPTNDKTIPLEKIQSVNHHLSRRFRLKIDDIVFAVEHMLPTSCVEDGGAVKKRVRHHLNYQKTVTKTNAKTGLLGKFALRFKCMKSTLLGNTRTLAYQFDLKYLNLFCCSHSTILQNKEYLISITLYFEDNRATRATK